MKLIRTFYKGEGDRQEDRETGLFSARGRIGRKSYFFRLSFCILLYLTALLPCLYAREKNLDIIYCSYTYTWFIFLVFPLALILFILIQRVKRMHDLNKNGWYSLVPFVSFVKGTLKNNEFGIKPGLPVAEYYDQVEASKKERISAWKRKKRIRTGFALVLLMFILVSFIPFLTSSKPGSNTVRAVNTGNIAGVYAVRQNLDNRESAQLYAEIREIGRDLFEVSLFSDYGKERFTFRKNEDGTLYSARLGKGTIETPGDMVNEIILVFRDNSNMVWKFTKS